MNKKGAKNNSVWAEFEKPESNKKLEVDIETEVLVVGGGIAGILCAYKLQQANHNVVLCEAKTVGCGITENTTAVISAQHDTMYQDLEKTVGFEKAKQYLYANLEAVEDYRKLSLKYDFDYEDVYSCIYSTDKSRIDNEIDVLKRMEYFAVQVDKIPLDVKMESGVVFPNQGQMNPLKLINELKKELTVYENTRIESIKNNVAYTKSNKIIFKHVVVCTHFPIVKNLAFSIRMHQNRSYVMAIKYDKPLYGTFVEDEKNGLYFRKYKDLLLIGGVDSRTGKKNSKYHVIEKYIEKHFPDCKLKYYWGNQDIITLDNIPYIGKIKGIKNCYVVTGFNEWGMTNAFAGANLILDLIENRESKYHQVFSPSRNIICKELFINMFEYLHSYFSRKDRKCTHMGCTLHYNVTERSWDCPCHGSRYNEFGEVINDPAEKDLE